MMNERARKEAQQKAALAAGGSGGALGGGASGTALAAIPISRGGASLSTALPSRAHSVPCTLRRARID